VEKYIKLNHEVTRAEWNEKTSTWRLAVKETYLSGEVREFTDEVDFLIGNIGVLNTWKWPSIPNREQFKGQITHSGNYDTSINCKGKRVCVIGSGASTLQIVPIVQKEASQLVSFYRTPQWVGPGLAVDGWTDSLGRNFTCK
jgi:cation diffusion facilitator CzcD-associated flavoprotein CzcO